VIEDFMQFASIARITTSRKAHNTYSQLHSKIKRTATGTHLYQGVLQLSLCLSLLGLGVQSHLAQSVLLMFLLMCPLQCQLLFCLTLQLMHPAQLPHSLLGSRGQ
jgi:hypothetical protein